MITYIALGILEWCNQVVQPKWLQRLANVIATLRQKMGGTIYDEIVVKFYMQAVIAEILHINLSP